MEIWNIVNGSLLQTLNGHTDWVNHLDVLPDNYLASASNDKTIKLIKFSPDLVEDIGKKLN